MLSPPLHHYVKASLSDEGDGWPLVFPVWGADSVPAPADYKGPHRNRVWPLASATYGETEIN